MAANPYKRLTAEEERLILELYAQGVPTKWIGEHVKRHEVSIAEWLMRRGLYKSRQYGAPCTLPTDEIRRLQAAGCTPHEIAKAIGRNYRTVYAWMVRNDLPTGTFRKCLTIRRAIAAKRPTDGIARLLDSMPLTSMTTIAERSGYHYQTVRGWLDGTRMPSPDALTDLAQTLIKLGGRVDVAVDVPSSADLSCGSDVREPTSASA